MEKNRYVRIIEGEEVGRDDPIESLEFQRGDGNSRMKRFLVKRRMEGEKESVLLSVGEEQIGGA